MKQLGWVFALAFLVQAPAFAQYSCDGKQDQIDGKNFRFVRCYAESSDRTTRMISMTVDPRAFPSTMTIKTQTSFQEQQRYHDRDTTFLMNGPMYQENGKPVGLVVSDGVEVASLDPAEDNPPSGGGNFYGIKSKDFENNGVIILFKDGTTRFLTRSDAQRYFSNKSEVKKIQMAFQGGPILVKNGKINDAIGPNSPNVKPRSAVCLTKSGKVRYMATNYLPPSGTGEGGMSFYKFANAGLSSKCVNQAGGAPDPCEHTLYVDGSKGVVDADFSQGGLNSDSNMKKNVFVVKLVP
jgi:uncharacterized protein YigE (DUF2233 family)